MEQLVKAGTRPDWDKPNNPTPAQWEEVKGIFEKYYLDPKSPDETLTLNQIRMVMAERHNFHANEAQYKNRIRRWGFRRNINQELLRHMLRIQDKRARSGGKKTAFRFHGNPVSEKKLQRLRKRLELSQPIVTGQDQRPVTPPCISYSTPATQSDAVMDTTPVDVPVAKDSIFEAIDSEILDFNSAEVLSAIEKACSKLRFIEGHIDLDSPTTPLGEAVTVPFQRILSEGDTPDDKRLVEATSEEIDTIDLVDTAFRQLHFRGPPSPQSTLDLEGTASRPLQFPRPPSPQPATDSEDTGFCQLQFLRPPSAQSDPFHPGKDFFGYGKTCRKRSIRGSVWMSSGWGGESVMGSWVKDDIIMSERWPFGSDSHSVCSRDNLEKQKEDLSASDPSVEPAKFFRFRDSMIPEVFNSVNFQLFTKI